MKLSLKDFQKLGGAAIIGSELHKGKAITGISTDSRAIERGNVFIALRGDRFDGHQFVGDVVRRGAAIIVVGAQWIRENLAIAEAAGKTFVAVPDTVRAFGELANIYRRKFDLPILIIGGSNGKTTTKDMIGAVLKEKFNVLTTEGNLNNQIGVPHMLFRLSPRHEIAVLEFGTNHFGELKYLCEIVEPTHSLVTNIGKEHLEFFGDLEGVAREETELFRFVKENRGFAFVNSDDSHLSKEAKSIHRKLTYGLSAAASIRARKVRMSVLGRPEFEIHRKGKAKALPIRLSVSGAHNVMNALAAAAVGTIFRVPGEKIGSALGKFLAPSKRMEIIERNGIVIINDAYNANPDSVLAALRTLMLLQIPGKKVVVLGDMLELGDQSIEEHRRVGIALREMGFQNLLTFGQFSKSIWDAAVIAVGEHCESKGELVSRLREFIQRGDAVLIKGSRGMKMEEVVNQL